MSAGLEDGSVAMVFARKSGSTEGSAGCGLEIEDAIV
jgi:hypothetical protein